MESVECLDNRLDNTLEDLQEIEHCRDLTRAATRCAAVASQRCDALDCAIKKNAAMVVTLEQAVDMGNSASQNMESRLNDTIKELQEIGDCRDEMCAVTRCAAEACQRCEALECEMRDYKSTLSTIYSMLMGINKTPQRAPEKTSE